MTLANSATLSCLSEYILWYFQNLSGRFSVLNAGLPTFLPFAAALRMKKKGRSLHGSGKDAYAASREQWKGFRKG